MTIRRFTLTVPAAGSDYLDTLYASLGSANTWSGEISANMPTINQEIASMRPNEGQPNDLMIDWAGAMRWSAEELSLYICGAPNGTQDVPAATNVLRYNKDTNEWTAVRNPWATSMVHCYDSTAVDGPRHRLYKRRLNYPTIYALNLSTQVSAGSFAAASEAYADDISVTTLNYFPDRDELVAAWGRGGVVGDGRIFTTPGGSPGTWTNRGGRALNIAYGCMSCYVPAAQQVLLLGGDNSNYVYRYAADGNVYPAASLPAGVTPTTNTDGSVATHGHLVPHPTQAKALLLYSDGAVREYTFATDSWATISNLPVAARFPTGSDYIRDSVTGCVPGLGLVFLQYRITTSSVVYFYRVV